MRETIKSITSIKEQNKLEVNFEQFVTDHIHMSLNRLFTSNPRKYELVVYNFAKKFYFSKIARQKNNKSEKI